MALNRDEYGFDAPVELGHLILSSLLDGHSTGLEVGIDWPIFNCPTPPVGNLG